MKTYIRLNIAVSRGMVEDYNAQTLQATDINDAISKGFDEYAIEEAICLHSGASHVNGEWVHHQATREEVIEQEDTWATINAEEESYYIIEQPSELPEVLYVGFCHETGAPTFFSEDELSDDILEEIAPELDHSITTAQDADYTYFIVSTFDMEAL